MIFLPKKIYQLRGVVVVFVVANLRTMTLAEGIGYGVPQISVCIEQKSAQIPIVLNVLNMASLLLMFLGQGTNLAILMTLNIRLLGLL